MVHKTLGRPFPYTTSDRTGCLPLVSIPRCKIRSHTGRDYFGLYLNHSYFGNSQTQIDIA